MGIFDPAILDGYFTLTLPKFEKWNPARKNRDGSVRGNQRRDWFYVDVNFFLDPKIRSLNANEERLWWRLVGLRAGSQGVLRGITLGSLRVLIPLRGSSMRVSLTKLLKLQMIEIEVAVLKESKEKERKEKEQTPAAIAAPLPKVSSSERTQLELVPESSEKRLPDLLTLWNDNCGALMRAKATTVKRTAAWRRLWRDNPDLAYWHDIIQRLARSPFASGENDRGWKADLDFFLKPESHVRVSEGKYDRGSGPGKETDSQKRNRLYQQGFD